MRYSVSPALLLTLAACGGPSSPNIAPYDNTPLAAVSKLGYDPVALPSTAYGPGSLVTSVAGTGMTAPLKLTYLCNPRFTTVPAPIVDRAASADASRALSGAFSLDTLALRRLGIDIGAAANQVASVQLKFSNVSVEQLAFDDLAAVRQTLGPVCQQLVADYASRNLAYQTKQAIRADVDVTANFTRGASLSAKQAVVDALGAQLALSGQGNDASTLVGHGLYYGLILVPLGKTN